MEALWKRCYQRRNHNKEKFRTSCGIISKQGYRKERLSCKWWMRRWMCSSQIDHLTKRVTTFISNFPSIHPSITLKSSPPHSQTSSRVKNGAWDDNSKHYRLVYSVFSYGVQFRPKHDSSIALCSMLNWISTILPEATGYPTRLNTIQYNKELMCFLFLFSSELGACIIS